MATHAYRFSPKPHPRLQEGGLRQQLEQRPVGAINLGNEDCSFTHVMRAGSQIMHNRVFLPLLMADGGIRKDMARKESISAVNFKFWVLEAE